MYTVVTTPNWCILLHCFAQLTNLWLQVPALVEQLEQRGAHVIVVPTRSALHFLRAAAKAGARKPPESAATAGAETLSARSVLPSALANANEANRNVTVNNEGREGPGVREFYDADDTYPCQNELKCYETRGSVLEKMPEVDNRIRESEDQELIQEKYCVTENSCANEKGVQSTLVHCCTKASDFVPSAGTDLEEKCSCDCVQLSSKCEVGFSTNTVQPQTEIDGVNCYPIRDSSDVFMNNSSDNRKPKTIFTSILNPAHNARAPSHCLSCLKMLEATALGGFKSQYSTPIPPGASGKIKHSALASPQPSPGDLTRPDAVAGGDSCSQLDPPPPNCDWCATQRLLPGLVIAGDALEWEGWRGRGDPVLHIELRRWADVGVIAPLSANTLAKMVSAEYFPN